MDSEVRSAVSRTARPEQLAKLAFLLLSDCVLCHQVSDCSVEHSLQLCALCCEPFSRHCTVPCECFESGSAVPVCISVLSWSGSYSSR